MTKLSEIFGLRAGEPTALAPATSHAENPEPSDEAAAASQPQQVASGTISAEKIGEENEALRNLLVDAGMKIRQFDEYKVAFSKLIEPATVALRTLEQEKTNNIDLRRKLEQSVGRCDELRARTHELETRHAILIGENEKLRQELELARIEARDAERSRAEFANETLAKRSVVSDLERQLALENSRANTLTDESQRLRDDTVAAQAKASRLAADMAAAQDKIDFLEGEVGSLQKSLDQVSEQATHAARRFADSENALTAAKARLLQLDASHNEAAAERDRLRTTLETNSARHGSEQSRVEMQIEAVRARAAAAEKLLGEARRMLAQRGEELRELDQKHTEANYALEKAEKRIAAAEGAVAAQQGEFNELKTSRDRLIEKSGVVVSALKLRETQLQHAENAAKSANERALRAEVDARTSGEAFQRRLEELTTVLERERLDHQVTAGALESTRNEREQLQSRLLQLQMEANRLAVNDADDMEFPTRGANAA
jgi:epidermal growth factor receptor substrate 15